MSLADDVVVFKGTSVHRTSQTAFTVSKGGAESFASYILTFKAAHTRGLLWDALLKLLVVGVGDKSTLTVSVLMSGGGGLGGESMFAVVLYLC